MTRDAIKVILEQPPKTKIGIHDRFFMLFLYGTGARVSEALNVRLKDLEIATKDPFVRILGKGNKPRCVPLLDITVENLHYYLRFIILIGGLKITFFTLSLKAQRIVCPLQMRNAS